MNVIGKNGDMADVTGQNELSVYGATKTSAEDSLMRLKKAYNIVVDQAATAGDDCFLYIENGEDEDMILDELIVSVAGAQEVYAKLGDSRGTPNSGTNATVTNRSSGSANSLSDCTIQYGGDLDNGAAAFSGGSEVDRWAFTAANQSARFELGYRLPKGQVCTFWASGTNANTVTVKVHLEDNQR